MLLWISLLSTVQSTQKPPNQSKRTLSYSFTTTVQPKRLTASATFNYSIEPSTEHRQSSDQSKAQT